MTNEWHTLYITDKSGKAYFKTTASPLATMSEVKNLSRHLEAIKSKAKGYEFADAETAVLMLDGAAYKSENAQASLDDILSDDELLAMLED